jgi:hypothetical protein
MNSQNAQATTHWGVHLTGHQFDLADWEEALMAPFEPWVERSQDLYVLRWTGFDGLQISEVHARAQALVEQLNGAMAAARGSRPIRVNGVVQFDPAGTRHVHVMAAMAAIEGRSSVSAIGRVIGPDGVVMSDAAPQPSEVQRWTTIADTDDRLADALVYLGKGEWFDLYKAIECIKDWAGGETALDKLGWIEPGELTRVKRTANSFRHRRGGHPPLDDRPRMRKHLGPWPCYCARRLKPQKSARRVPKADGVTKGLLDVGGPTPLIHPVAGAASLPPIVCFTAAQRSIGSTKQPWEGFTYTACRSMIRIILP